MAGEYADGLQTLDELVERKWTTSRHWPPACWSCTKPSSNGKPIDGVEQDRARMVKLADAYRVRGGPSLALIDTWLAAAKK